MRQVHITQLQPDGRGAGRDAEGRLVHVPGAVPGDLAEVDLAPSGRQVRLLDARVQPGAQRRAPPCPYDARCGGCDLSVMQPEARRRALADMVARCLRVDTPIAIRPSPRPTGHRARVSLRVMDGRLGFHGARSHEHVPVSRCGVARPEINDALVSLQRVLDAHPSLPAEEVALRSDGARVVVCMYGTIRPSSEQVQALAALNDVAWNDRVLHGDPTLTLRVCGVVVRASPGTFYQVNLEQNAALVAAVRDAAIEIAPERVLDLYCGNGNLGLPIAAAGLPLLGVEREGRALEDLREAAREQGLDVRALGLDANRFDPSREAFDLAVLDPPRAGAGKVLSRVLGNRPRRVIYVACNPLALGRDLRVATAAGYRLTRAACFDMFPDTHHVETVAVLDR